MKLNLVPARTGATWVRSGLQTFAKRPLAFMALFMFFMALISIASQVPLVGTVIALMLLPTMTLGLMAAAAAVSDIGAPPNPVNLFQAAFHAVRADVRPLAVLGALYAVLFLLVVGISTLIDGGLFARVYLLGEPVTRELAENGSFQAALWLSLVFYAPLSMTFWHAPALVHWHRIPPAKSLFFSFVACFRTLGALVIFLLVWMVVIVGAGMLLSTITVLLAALGLFGNGGDVGTAMGSTLVMGGVLVTAAMFFTSAWFSFKSTFDAGNEDIGG
jgi:hypothetical protein